MIQCPISTTGVGGTQALFNFSVKEFIYFAEIHARFFESFIPLSCPGWMGIDVPLRADGRAGGWFKTLTNTYL